MADNQPNKPQDSIFQGVIDAINGGKRKTPEMAHTAQFSTKNDGQGLIAKDNVIETIQQEYLDWQVNKIAHNLYQRTLYFDTDRISAYQDFRAMDMSPEIAAALNIIRDECLTRNEKGNILEIYSENSRVKEVLKDLFNKRLNIEFNLKLWIRDLIKYGDYFVHLHIDGHEGIYNFKTLPVEEMHREDGYEGKPDAVRFRWEGTNDYFEEWQVAHFRLIEDTKKIPYGRSILDPARKLWKQLQLAEDSMLVYRITRAPERRVFYIEVGNLEDGDVKTYVQKIQNQLKKQPLVDSRTGNMNMKYNPMNITEDYFIPIRGDKSSRIDTLPGASNLGDIQDIEYLQNKLFAALQVPKTYLNYAESMPGGSTLSQADLRFARTINSIQEIVLMEMRRIANIHLYFAGFKDDIDNFSLSLTNPSTQQELLKLETMKARLEVAKEYYAPDATSFTSWTWVMENILGFSKQDIKLILKQKKVEKKIFAEIDAAVDTYKKIGLFNDLDAKYEIPGAVAKPGDGDDSGDGGSGGGGGSSLGGLGGGGGGSSLGGLGGGGGLPGGEELGGGPGGEVGAETGLPGGGVPGAEETTVPGAEEPATEEIPLAESKQNKLQKILKESDSRFDVYLDDLLGKEKVIEEAPESLLLKNNRKLNYKTEKLFERIQQNIELGKDKSESNIIQEAKEENPLFSNNEKLIYQTNEMMLALESLFKPKEVIEEIADNNDDNDIEYVNEEIIYEGDNGMDAHQGDQQRERTQDKISNSNSTLMGANQDDQQRERTQDKIVSDSNTLMGANQDETNSSMLNQTDTGTGLNAHQGDAQKNNTMSKDSD